MNHCSPTPVFTTKGFLSFAKQSSSALGFMILLLPKCPFCIVAYSGNHLCSASSLVTHNVQHNGIGAFIALATGLLITECILFTYKPVIQNKLASALSIIGMILLCIGIFKADALICYYIGAGLLVTATIIYSGIINTVFEKRKTEF